MERLQSSIFFKKAYNIRTLFFFFLAKRKPQTLEPKWNHDFTSTPHTPPKGNYGWNFSVHSLEFFCKCACVCLRLCILHGVPLLHGLFYALFFSPSNIPFLVVTSTSALVFYLSRYNELCFEGVFRIHQIVRDSPRGRKGKKQQLGLQTPQVILTREISVVLFCILGFHKILLGNKNCGVEYPL